MALPVFSSDPPDEFKVDCAKDPVRVDESDEAFEILFSLEPNLILFGNHFFLKYAV